MKLGSIVSAVNLNPHYMSFVPQFIRAWTTLFPQLDILVIVVADEMPEEFLPYAKYLRLFPMPSEVSSVLAAQCIRLLWPRTLDTKDAVLITDIDMIPMNREYYVNNIKNVSNDTVVVYRHGLPEELYMCYVAAAPAVWRGMFGDDPAEEILTRWHSEANVWNKDQIELTKAFNTWTGPKTIYTDRETGFRRLCRSYAELPLSTIERQLIEDRKRVEFLTRMGFFADYHMLPNSDYQKFNDFVLDCIAKAVDREPFVQYENFTSYLPLLFCAIASSDAPIVECGMGNGSTPLLHSLNRTVLSYETNPEWFAKFDVPNKYLVKPDAWVSVVSMHKSSNPIVFIDQAPGESRELCIDELSDFGGIIVAHDTEPDADYGYKMRRHFRKFRYVVELKTQGAWATAMSNTVDVRQWINVVEWKDAIHPYEPPTTFYTPITPIVSIGKGLQNTFVGKLHTYQSRNIE